MKYYEMVEVSETMEFINIIDKKLTCKMTDEQNNKVKQQVQEIWGDTEILVSQKGVVFSNDKG